MWRWSMIWGGTPRSPRWPALRAAFIKGRQCAGCDAGRDLEAHHIVPYHIDPARELDTANLICLCRDCHFVFGHLRDWSASNPQVREDAALFLQRIRDYRRPRS
jgi:hypothetical protein